MSNAGDDSQSSTKPSLDRLAVDTETIIKPGGGVPGIRGGFDTREALVAWLHELVIRTAGEVPGFVLQGMATQLVSPRERPVVAALLADGADMSDQTSEHWRNRIVSKLVNPAYERAYRKLRKNATEYVDGEHEHVLDDEEPSPMSGTLLLRPSMRRLADRQRDALEPVFGGFDSREHIREWSRSLVDACYGEPIQLPDDSTMNVTKFVERMERRDPWREMLIDTENERKRVREAWAARFLLPTFNKAARSEFGASAEVLQIEQQATEEDFKNV